MSVGRPKEISDEQIIITARECFLSRGVSVSAIEIARELGVSHTTLFNRFGSKERLMIAALGPPKRVDWIEDLNSGPDTRPLLVQLIAHAKVIASFFRQLSRRLDLLKAAGIDTMKICEQGGSDSTPSEQAFHAFVSWLRRAQKQGLLANCDVEIVASIILSSLQGHAFTSQILKQACVPDDDEYVERFINLLWEGIGP